MWRILGTNQASARNNSPYSKSRKSQEKRYTDPDSNTVSKEYKSQGLPLYYTYWLKTTNSKTVQDILAWT
jgi:hypothetical protein